MAEETITLIQQVLLLATSGVYVLLNIAVRYGRGKGAWQNILGASAAFTTFFVCSLAWQTGSDALRWALIAFFVFLLIRIYDQYRTNNRA